ncbi:MAG: amidase [Rhodospirillales bacterium]|nr:amidase [Rhodospirillales bacterium]MDE0379008.1 amidase [Rhodospirillales bacterium]
MTAGGRAKAAPALPECPHGVEIAATIRAGRGSAADACAAALARIAETESRVHAWAHLDAEHALRQARAIGDAGPSGALAGVPVAVKDIVDTADLPTENGTPLDSGRRPDADATVVRRLCAAGAVILGKTVTTELACGAANETRNPHGLGHTPGGSSSGSAATVAAGGVPLALGTQTAGSVVRPAAFCGVWGMKPSFGAIPRSGVTRLARTLDHVGVLAGSVEDVALGIDVISGDDGLDQASTGRPPTRLAAALGLPLGQPRLAFVREPAWDEVEADAAAAYEGAAAELGAAPLGLGPEFADARAVHLGIMRREVAHAFAPWAARGEARLSDVVREHIEGGRAIDADTYLSLLDRADAMRRAFEQAMRPYDAALTPAAPGGAPEGLAFTGSRSQTMLWTMLGVPAINVPVLTVGGLPLGLQVVGRFGADATTLRAAAWCAARLQEARG